ncbi:hypothetical protein [Jannaschia seohaensis]|uniref:Uncharacterized protein n=1 Tax=Jannaschia seohaensis TaxID=475081 RepID=A0A2Y9AG78_9RHOB|nr:hypothetical protein [Jannaschia seohaensis]PWJ21159.1 hypothetical protein BCF38_102409 [Jannaschia seohaensis]SSA41569.1 hypothetical protein SAMN05421539_102409 [Jannaschia seohaensis]
MDTRRLAVTIGHGGSHQVLDDTGTEIFKPTRISSFADQAVVFRAIEVSRTDVGASPFAWSNTEEEFFRSDPEGGRSDLNTAVSPADFAGAPSDLA